MRISKVNYLHDHLKRHLPDLDSGLRRLDDPRTGHRLCAAAHRILEEVRGARAGTDGGAPLVAKRKIPLSVSQDAALARLRTDLPYPWYVILNAALLAVVLDGTCQTASQSCLAVPEWLREETRSPRPSDDDAATADIAAAE